jgi:hypothetical protein
MRINITPVSFGPTQAVQFSAENHRLLLGNVASLVTYWSAVGEPLYRTTAQLTTENYLAWCETDSESDDDHWLTLAHAAQLGLEVQGQPHPQTEDWEVLRDTIVSRVAAVIGIETTFAIIASLPEETRLRFLTFDRYSRYNDEIRAMISQIPNGQGGTLDPDVIMARDPKV